VKDFEEILKSASKDVGVTSGYRRQLTLSAASSSTIEEEDINRRAIRQFWRLTCESRFHQFHFRFGRRAGTAEFPSYLVGV